MVIAILFAIFILQNAEVVEVRFLFWGTEASRAIVLLVTFFIGLVSGWLTVWKHQKPGSDKLQDHPRRTNNKKGSDDT